MPSDDKTGPNLHDVLAKDIRGIQDKGDQGPGTPPTETALRAIAPRPVPTVVLSIGRKSAAGIAESLSRIPDLLDDEVARYPVKIELRADLLPGFSERMTGAALILRLGVPVIVTLRSRAEGGGTTLTEPERQRFFLSLASALKGSPPPGSLIDLEAAAVASDPEGWGQVIEQVREHGFEVLLSHHDFATTPDDDHGLLPSEGLLDTTPGGSAAIWKAATTVTHWHHELALLSALRRGNAATRRASIMGMGTPTARLLAPFFGAPLVYATVDADASTAPGQVPFADLIRTWTRWGIHIDDDALAARATEHGYPPRWVLLGRPAWHSLSPAMHNAAARKQGHDGRYFPLQLPPGEQGSDDREVVQRTLLALRTLGVTGGNATVPFKGILADIADDRTGPAAALGVANTFRFENGRLVATNTDPHGVRAALEAEGLAIPDAKVLVVGAGGSATAAAYGLRDAAALSVTNRTPANADALAATITGLDDGPDHVQVVPWDDRIAAASDADIIVHCTSIGMHGGPAPGEDPLAGVDWRPDQTVVDLVYVPRKTPLLTVAANAGARAIDGSRVLLHQAAEAYRFWTGNEPPVDTMANALITADQIPFPDTVRAATERQEVDA